MEDKQTEPPNFAKRIEMLCSEEGNAIINVHCHLAHQSWMPKNYAAEYFRFFVRDIAEKRTGPFGVYVLKPLLKYLAVAFSWISPNRMLQRILKLLAKISRGTDYYGFFVSADAKNVIQVADEYLKLAGETNPNVVLSCPLLLDFAMAAEKPRQKPDKVWQDKILRTAFFAHQKRAFLPFINFHPGRGLAGLELAEYALKNLGFMGVKIYPPFQHFPNGKLLTKDGVVIDNPEGELCMRDLYRFCSEGQVPITAHCQPISAFSMYLLKHSTNRTRYTNPGGWKEIFEKYEDLRINLGHMGGYDFSDPQSELWTDEVAGLMREHSSVYGDVAAHNAMSRHPSYFRELRRVLERESTKNRIMFGTDFPMDTVELPDNNSEREFVGNYVEQLGRDRVLHMGRNNALHFLFGSANLKEVKETKRYKACDEFYAKGDFKEVFFEALTAIDAKDNMLFGALIDELQKRKSKSLAFWKTHLGLSPEEIAKIQEM